MNRSQLSRQNLSLLPASVRRPHHDHGRHAPGLVHFGPGAFFRAHQAAYVDDLLAHDPRWGIAAVALRSSGVRDALAAQDWLYTLALMDEQPQTRVIGALAGVTSARDDAATVRALLAAPTTHVVTLTVTEKGYCLAPDGGLDTRHPDIEHDLQSTAEPVSVIGWLVEGFRLRRAAGLPAFTVISCDNLVANGHKLRRAVVELARAKNPALADWIEGEARFPCTMVDSITPATDDALRARVTNALGLEDAWPVQREAFSQWVIEDCFAGPRPPLDQVGVTFTADVGAYERAKLRLLNGPHSALAYIGLLIGHETVADAMADPVVSGFVTRLMREDIAPTLTPTPGLDLEAYGEAVRRRFRNPAIRHMLSQIAWDGSQKLPYRLLGTIQDRLAAGTLIDRLVLPIAAWMHFIRRRSRENATIVDPLAERLAGIGRACTGTAREDVDRFLALDAVFPPGLVSNTRFRAALTWGYAALEVPQAVLGSL